MQSKLYSIGFSSLREEPEDSISNTYKLLKRVFLGVLITLINSQLLLSQESPLLQRLLWAVFISLLFTVVRLETAICCLVSWVVVFPETLWFLGEAYRGGHGSIYDVELFYVKPNEVMLGVIMLKYMLPRLIAQEQLNEIEFPIKKPMILMLLAVPISALFGIISGSSLYDIMVASEWRIGVQSFLFLYVFANTFNTVDRLKGFIWFFVALVGAKAFVVLLKYLVFGGGVAFLGPTNIPMAGRIPLLMTSVAILVMLSYIIEGHANLIRRILVSAVTFILLALVFISMRRVPIATVALGLASIFYFSNLRGKTKILAIGCLCAVGLFMIIRSPFLSIDTDFVIKRAESFNVFGFSATDEIFRAVERSNKSHIADIKYGLKLVADSPLLGHGFGVKFAKLREQMSVGSWVGGIHNGYLLIWIKMGILGFVGYIWLVFSMLIRGSKNIRDLPAGVKYLATGLWSLLPGIVIIDSMFMGTFWGSFSLGILVMIVIGSLANISRLDTLKRIPEPIEQKGEEA